MLSQMELVLINTHPFEMWMSQSERAVGLEWQDPELLKNPFLLLPYPPSLCSEPCSSQWVRSVLDFQSPWRGS